MGAPRRAQHSVRNRLGDLRAKPLRKRMQILALSQLDKRATANEYISHR